jgi:glycosyltransferase involved in cell wall biosynthesis
MAKLVLLLRVKDGMLFVHEWLACFEKLADEIVVLDNGSTDGTDKVLEAHPKVVDFMRTEGYNEGRDKTMLYEAARKRNPDWCLWLDVDEIFEAGLTRADFDRLMNRKYVNKYAFRRFHFIDREYFAGSWYRLNYSSGHDRILWRENPSGFFENKILDSPNVKGIRGLKVYTNFRLKHLGYISKELVDKKADIYRAIPGEREATLQGMYLNGERPIRWSDRRNSSQVVLINGLLNVLLFKNLGLKAVRKVAKMVTGRFQKPGNMVTT